VKVPDRVKDESEEKAALRPGIERNTENMIAETESFIVRLIILKKNNVDLRKLKIQIVTFYVIVSAFRESSKTL
jgi:hypothetical protein